MAEEKENIENKRTIEDDEIDLVELAKTIWAHRKIIYKTTLIFFILGIIVAFGSKVEYEASCKLLPDSEEGAMPDLGGLGGLAGLAGINLNMGAQSTLSPALYPQIVQSLPFQLKVINKELNFTELDTTITSYQYFKEIDSPSFLGYVIEYTIGLPWKVKDLFTAEGEESNVIDKEGNSKIIRLSKEDSKFIEEFKERIAVEVDEETGMITLATEMPDPMAAAELAQTSVSLLQQHIIDYKISKTQENLRFVKERYNEARQRFNKAQENLAIFSDRNQNVITARARTEQQRLQNEYNLAFEVYQGLAQQLEQAEIKVKEDTPVFTMVEPVKVPVEKSEPRRSLILAVSFFLGITLGIVGIFMINVYKSFKTSIGA